MDVFALGLKIKEEGAATVEKATNSLRASLGKLNLGAILAGAGLATLTRQLVATADQAKLLDGRLKLVTGSADELRAVQDALFVSSQRTRSDYEASVQLYARVARSTRDLGIAQSELLRFTELTTMAIKTSGATSVEASAALVQLSQGLAAGVLRGEEFNSVMEQTPGLALAIANGLGVGIRQLRELAQQGKLTAGEVINAVLKMDASIRNDFATSPKTVSDAFVVMKNDILRAIGEIDGALGTSSAFARLLQFGAEVIRDLTPRGGTRLADLTAAQREANAFAASAAGKAFIALRDQQEAARVAAQKAREEAERQTAAMRAQADELVNLSQLTALSSSQVQLLQSVNAGYTAALRSGTLAVADRVAMLQRQVAIQETLTAQQERATAAERIQRQLQIQLANEGKQRLGTTITGGVDSGQMAGLRLPLLQPLIDEASVAAAEAASKIRETFSDAIGGAIVAGIAVGIESAIASGRIGDGFAALGSAMLMGLGDAAIRFGVETMALGTLMQDIVSNFASLLPGGAIAKGAAMIAFGAALKGAAGAAFGGGARGTGRSPTNPLGAFAGGAIGTTAPTQLIFGPTSATTAAGMTPRQAVNVTLIGPNDPTAQRAMQELLRNANQRGTLG